MNLSDLLSTARLSELIASHHISRIVSPNGRHWIFDYTEKATYDRLWTPETTICRGLVVESDPPCRVIARAFDKFHNLGESGIERASIEAVTSRGNDYEVWSKMDGSMVLLWWDGQTWRTSTRGSFTSEQARAALVWIRAHVSPWDLDPRTCYVGEWIGPDNRIVVNYPQHEWVLTGARNMDTMQEAHRAELHRIADQIGVRSCPFWIARDFSEILAAQVIERGIEGWVLRWSDGFRVKVKTEEYLAIHRLISNLTPRRIHEALCTGAYAQYLTALPEEYRPEAERIASEITSQATTLTTKAHAVFSDLRPLLSDGRKAFALEAVKHPDVRPYLFLLADDRPIADKVLKDCEPL